MRFSSSVLAFAATLSTASAGYKGFNYGAFFNNQQAKVLADFQYEFNAAKQLPGTNGQFTSARLYTMIQHGTASTVIEAIQAAINTKTSLLLGLWASAGQANFNNEIAALKAATQQYGSAFTDLVVGISVGSEDLYRNSVTGQQNKELAGAQPNELVNYIQQTRAAIRGTGLAGKPIGHVDTWTAYVNGSNNAVISALDFLGVDAYPYFQTTMANSIGNANQTFYDAFRATIAASQGKPVWVTETGWPVTGDTRNLAVASAQNAKIYWDDVSCSLMKNNVNLYYYTLQDVQWGNPNPSFGIKPAGDLMQVKPLFDLTCPGSSAPPTQSLTSSMIVPSTEIPSTISALPPTTTELVVPTSAVPVVTPPVINPDPPQSSPFIIVDPNPTPALPVINPDPSVGSFKFPEAVIDPLPVPELVPALAAAAPLVAKASTNTLTDPTSLNGRYEFPHLIVPIDIERQDRKVGNQFVAQISSSFSSLFNFDVPSDTAGKTCNLVFYLTPVLSEVWDPLVFLSPGGISVARLDNYATPDSTYANAGSSKHVGQVDNLIRGQGHLVSSAPCEAGQTVGYRIDALRGLNIEYFQLSNPPLGFFMTVD